jgi:hypothetical protein
MTEEILVDEVGLDGMTATEREMADNIYSAMMLSMHESDRSQQAQEFRVGVSDLGFCSERLRRFLAREVPEEIDMLPAFHGTWLGEGIERAVGRAYPESIIQSTVTVPLKGEDNTYEITGHPDIIFPNGVLLDVKSAYGLSLAARTGMEDLGKKFQRHCYAYGAWKEGLFDPDLSLNDLTVGNVWVDRSAEERRLLVKTEPFDMQVVSEAEQWLDEVVYNWKHGEQARKEPPIEMCKKVCGFFEPCRGMESRAEGLLTDPTVIEAVNLDIEGAALAKQAKRMREEAKSNLRGIQGSTGTYEVFWQSFGAAKIEAYERAPYDVLKIKKIKT